MTRFERWFVWGSTAAVSVSGFGYAGIKYLVRPTDPFAVVNHPLQPVLLKLHVLTAPLFMFGIGLIALRHIWPHIRSGARRGRRSGLSAALVLVPMVVSGYLIQAVTHVGWLKALVIAHLVTGTVFALGAGAHRLAARRGVRGVRGADDGCSAPVRRGEASPETARKRSAA